MDAFCILASANTLEGSTEKGEGAVVLSTDKLCFLGGWSNSFRASLISAIFSLSLIGNICSTLFLSGYRISDLIQCLGYLHTRIKVLKHQSLGRYLVWKLYVSDEYQDQTIGRYFHASHPLAF